MDYRLRETTRDPAFLFSPSSETSSNMETLISVVTRKLVQSTQCSQKLVPSFAVVQERAIFQERLSGPVNGRYHPLHLRKYRNQRVPLANSRIIKYVRIN